MGSSEDRPEDKFPASVAHHTPCAVRWLRQKNASHQRFYPDLEDLPFYDSPDDLEYIFRMEKILGMKLSSEALTLEYPIRLPSRVGDLTVGDMIDDAIGLHRQRKQSGEP